MAVSERAKEKLDEASKEIREAIENLREDVSELTKKVREKLKGSGEDMRGSAEELTREVRTLSERIRDLVPKRGKSRLPVRVEKYPEIRPDLWQQPLLELRRTYDRLFDDFFNTFRWPMTDGPWASTTDMVGTDWPRVDMAESDNEIQITAELPGVDKDNIDVSVSQDRLTIRGEKNKEKEIQEKGYYRLERSYGSFQRNLSLPCEVESDKVNASFKNGVLTVRLPKSAAAREKTRKIPVHTR